jgi:dipeptidyl aminopeptidase/acylaminoacyl peptidase
MNAGFVRVSPVRVLASVALLASTIACGSGSTTAAPAASSGTPASAPSAAAGDAPQTWEAYLSLPSVATFRWAPTGTRIAYVASVDGKTGLFLVDAAGPGTKPTRLADGNSPTWSPDGNTIAYLSGGDIWTVPAAGGAPARITNGPEDERGIEWSPDGQSIAFMSIRDKAQDVWVVPAAGGTPKQLTSKTMDEDEVRFDVSWSPDSKQLLFISNKAAWDHDDLWLVPATGGEPTRLTTKIRARFPPVWSPDGKAIALQAFAHEEFSYGDMTDLYVVDVAGKKEHKVALPTYISGQPSWSPDGKEIIVAITNHADTNLWRVGLGDEKNPTQITYVQGHITQQDYSHDGKWIAYLHSSPVRPNTLMLMPAIGGQAKALVDVAPPLAGLRAPLRVGYRSYDGKYIDGFLYLPPGVTDPNVASATKYPSVIQVHGGGTNLYRNSFNPIEQLFAQKGFIVLAVNYRGSSTYGRAFQDLSTLDWGNGQAHDAALAAPYLRSLPISNGKVGIYGYSYGGITSMAAAARYPDYFDAAVPMAGIYDFAAAYAPADRVGKLFYALGHGGSPEKNPAAYAHTRTLSHIADVKAPILTLHGEADVRAPFVQYQMLTAELKKYNKVFEGHTYPGEPHGFRSVKNRANLYERCEAWMRKYLQAGAAS